LNKRREKHKNIENTKFSWWGGRRQSTSISTTVNQVDDDYFGRKPKP